MRIYEGDYAYEVERIFDSATLVQTGWRYNIYRVRPRDELLRTGIAKTMNAAEKAGQRELAEVIEAEQRGENPRKKSAA